MQGLSFAAFGIGGIIATLASNPLSEVGGSWRFASMFFAGLSALTCLMWIMLVPGPSADIEEKSDTALSEAGQTCKRLAWKP